MNKEQTRHSKAMARKIREHAQAIVSAMSSIESLPEREFTTLPLSNITNRFTHDTGYGVQDRLTAIENVIAEMLPELK